jgi:hypothetical protein
MDVIETADKEFIDTYRSNGDVTPQTSQSRCSLLVESVLGYHTFIVPIGQ